MDNPPDPHDLPDAHWQRLPIRYIALRRWAALAWLGAITASAVVVAVIFNQWWLWLLAGALAAVTVTDLTLIPRRVRAFGYVCRTDDIAIRSGLLNRSLVIVPYGRIQSVSVTDGPLLRGRSLASLTILTASGDTAARIPAVDREQATALRDHLTALGEERMLAI